LVAGYQHPSAGDKPKMVCWVMEVGISAIWSPVAVFVVGFCKTAERAFLVSAKIDLLVGMDACGKFPFSFQCPSCVGQYFEALKIERVLRLFFLIKSFLIWSWGFQRSPLASS
jgi:hypothetical protein